MNPKMLQRMVATGVLGKKVIAPIIYVFRDEFTTAEASPITSPRTAEPGAGSWTVVQTAGTFAIVDGKLEITGPGSTENVTTMKAVTGLAQVGGRAIIFDRISGNVESEIGFKNNTGEKFVFNCNYTGSLGFVSSVSSSVIPKYLGLCDTYLLVFGDSFVGFEKIVKLFGKTGTTWKLLYVAEMSVRNEVFYPWIQSKYNTAKIVLDNFGVTDLLNSALKTSYGIVTDRKASPSTGDTLTGTADGIFRFAWTPAAGEVVDFAFRRTDDNNCWIMRCDQASGKVYLYEKNGGVETERGATGGTAQTFTAGTKYRLCVIADTAYIAIYVQETYKAKYETATFNQTATGLKVSGFATGVNFEAWPRVVSPF